MEAGRSLLVGIDLCDDMAQISYYDKKIYEPVPVGIPVGDKYIYEIPSALLVNPNTNEWLWKTKENMQLGGYTLISNLLSKIKKSEKFQEGSYIFKTKDVVKKFMVKLLSLLNEHFPNETILKLVITIPERENVIVDLLKNILAELGIRYDRLVILGHKQSYMYYAVSQPKELWANSVGLFEFDEMGLRYTNLTVDKRTIPYIVGADVYDLSDIMPYSVLQEKGDVKYMFLNTANTMLHKKMVTTIYVTDKVIIIDEAQNLKFLTLEEIRGWVDEDIFTGKPGIGIVLIGNVEVYNKMLGKQEAIFAQQFNRTKLHGRYRTSDISREDVIKFFPVLQEKGMQKEIDYLLSISHSKWGIRGMVSVFNNAVNNEDISFEGLEKMANTMGIRFI